LDVATLGLQVGLHFRPLLVRYRSLAHVCRVEPIGSGADSLNRVNHYSFSEIEIETDYDRRWPAGIYASFGGFCGATFIIGSGLGSLETAANPYLSVCGPPKYAELRINFAQAFNAIGTVVGPVLGSYVFFTETADSVQALKNVQWVYLGIAVFVFILAFVFFISYIPEITDADMEYQVQEIQIQGSEKPFWKQYRLFHAAFAQFCYCGAQGMSIHSSHFLRDLGFL
jgi:fucose permease